MTPRAAADLVFGCGGDRDRDKRPLMGAIARRARRHRRRHLRQPAIRGPGRDHRRDRRRDRAAPGRCRGRAGPARGDRAGARRGGAPGDTVLIAGKGHEQGQEFEGGRKIPFDDREVARDELRRLRRGRERDRARRRTGSPQPRAPRSSRAEATGAPSGRRSTRARWGRATCSSGLPASTPTAASSPPRRSRPAPGAWWSTPEHARRQAVASAGGVAVLGRRPAGGAAAPGARHGGASSARRWSAITGSTGKTSVKDICRGDPAAARVHASRENFNTEIGLPLTILEAPPETEFLVLEMAMRGPGQIAELCGDRRARRRRDHQRRPGPSRAARHPRGGRRGQGRAARRPRGGGRRSCPASRALEPHLRGELKLITLRRRRRRRARRGARRGGETEALVVTPAGEQRFKFPFAEAYNLDNALAAIAAGVALGVPLRRWPIGRRDNLLAAARRAHRAARRRLLSTTATTRTRSRCALPSITSASLEGAGAAIAVLGDMRSWGPTRPAYHREVGEHARGAGVEL